MRVIFSVNTSPGTQQEFVPAEKGKSNLKSEALHSFHLKPNYKMSEKQIVQELLQESNPQKTKPIFPTVKNKSEELLQFCSFLQNKSLSSCQ